MWLAIRNHEDKASLSQSTHSQSSLPLTERYALAVLYFHWAGWFWSIPQDDPVAGGWNLTWDARHMGAMRSNNECDWYGVECSQSDSSDMTVTKLNMTGGSFSLMGNLPTELGLLSGMQEFYAANNELVGDIPEELQAWTNLQAISLRFNRLTGLGHSYMNWTAVDNLDIGENRFQGNISAQALRRFSKIKTLSLVNNRDLNTDAPFFVAPDNGPYWPQLQDLSITATQVHLDLTHISGDNFPNLKTIDAAQAALTGYIPSTIGTLSKLEFLSLASPSYGQLTGAIPSEIGLLSNTLSFVALDVNGISGTLPTELGLLTNVKMFTAYMNSVSGTIPTEVGMMQSLQTFDISQNPLTGTIPTELGKCSSLVDLEVYYTELMGSMPMEICDLKGGSNAGYFKLGASCAITPETATARQLVCTCCTDCYGN